MAALTRSDLRAADVRAALAVIGRALTPEGDLLVYACRVAQGDEGALFLAELAEATGAHVAGSTTLTGATELGGDWILDARIGAVRTAPLVSTGFPDVLAPTVTVPDAVTYTEGDAPSNLWSGVDFIGGLGYPRGSITFGLTGGNEHDQLALASTSDPNVLGAISIVGDQVYLGTGSGTKLIGTVDATQNGQNGQPLTIRFLADDTELLSNPGFESGTTGWTVIESRVDLGTTLINGHLTPDDPTNPPNSGATAAASVR